MKMRKNARSAPLRREEMARWVLAGQTNRAEAVASFGVTANTVSKWVGRFRDFGLVGMPDHSLRPRRMRRPTPGHVVERVVSLWRCRLTGTHIASATGVSTATVSRILKRAGLSRIKDLESEEPARRYGHDNPDDMIHLDIKKLGRFVQPGHRATGTRAGRRQGSGWECAHICVDDASRVACDGLFPDEKCQSAVECLGASVAHYKRIGVTVRRVMTDNGPCYTSRAFAAACKALGGQARPDQALHAQDQRRRRASSRRPCGNGTAPGPTRPRSSAPPTSRRGCTCTTGTGRTPLLGRGRPSAGCGWSVITF